MSLVYGLLVSLLIEQEANAFVYLQQVFFIVRRQLHPMIRQNFYSCAGIERKERPYIDRVHGRILSNVLFI